MIIVDDMICSNIHGFDYLISTYFGVVLFPSHATPAYSLKRSISMYFGVVIFPSHATPAYFLKRSTRAAYTMFESLEREKRVEGNREKESSSEKESGGEWLFSTLF